MSYNKKVVLRNNIEAIHTVLLLKAEKRIPSKEEREILGRYNGFGGLKCVLNPASTLADRSRWAKSELELFPMVQVHIPADTRSAFPVISVQSPVSIQCCWQS